MGNQEAGPTEMRCIPKSNRVLALQNHESGTGMQKSRDPTSSNRRVAVETRTIRIVCSNCKESSSMVVIGCDLSTVSNSS
jgi:hypothetical protein